jgi:large subunit ribosomal protein L16
MLIPKKTKYRKVQKGKIRGRSKGARTIMFGDFGLMALEGARISARQIESVRLTVAKKLKKIGTLFIRMFPDKPVTKKPAETRMGKGKGNPELWVAVVKRERIIFELGGGLTEQEAKDIFRAAAYKLPIKTKFVTKEQDVAQKAEVVG